jgi:hypothetical protein
MCSQLAYNKLCEGLDALYFSSLGEKETIELRSVAIDLYIIASGWTWDKLIVEMAKPDQNYN